ncbi:complex I NDUFA9 subunit family protein [Roseiarcaceae bacterium H3SJ34-1]|uniref:complex I NDUFA9 subunit family protein n=1 Tax=Terripilifer ovatus TaxID=3032367 RepID=UPI003AB97FBA|nr:complex I NDUFA9 subunit family protein [Roseiarcaceae bacterium H3SJ34-1]
MTNPLDRSTRLVTVFGGSGFVGRHVVRALAQRGWRIRVACRRPDLAFHLQPIGKVGQIHAVQANLRYPASVASAVHGAEAVVNLVGILTESGRQRFDAVHGFGANVVARAAKAAGAASLIQMSAIGADAESASSYARSKAQGEAAARNSYADATIIRPSIVFGPEDDFFNRFAALARLSPVLPLIGGGATKFQPVYVGDVAEAIARVLDGQAAGKTLEAGKTWELGGPEVRTFRELLEFICTTIGRKRLLLPMPFPLARAQAFGSEIANAVSLGLYPKILHMTRDQVTLLQTDNVVSEAAKAAGLTLEGMGIEADSIEAIVPTYLYRFRKSGQFEARATA